MARSKVGVGTVMGIGTKPLFIDLAYGRVGSYITSDSTRAGFENHYFIPLNSFLKTTVIRDVPEGSLILIPAFDERCPSDLAILIAGEHGEAPLLNKYLKENWNKVLENITVMQRNAQITKSASDTQRRIMDRGMLGGSFNEQLKIIEKIRKSVGLGTGHEGRKGKTLSTFRED